MAPPARAICSTPTRCSTRCITSPWPRPRKTRPTRTRTSRSTSSAIRARSARPTTSARSRRNSAAGSDLRYDDTLGMRVFAAVSVALALAATTARADDEVGVVVTGDATLRGKLAAHLRHWLSDHGHGLAESPLSTDAI